MKGNAGKTINITLMVRKYRNKDKVHINGREKQERK